MFIDLHKTYDTVPVTKLWKLPQEPNINNTFTRVQYQRRESSAPMEKEMQRNGSLLEDTCVYTLQFADDQIIIANDKYIEYIKKKLQEEYKLWGLEINTQKTKYLPIGAKP